MRPGLVFAILLAGTIPATAQDADALYRQGLRLLGENQLEPASKALEESVRLRPENASAWKALGVVRAMAGEYDRAEKPFQTACRLQPGLADACFYYGRTLYLLNQFKPALDVLQRLHEDAQVLRLTALSFEGLGQTAEAERAFQKALQLNRAGTPNDDPGIDYGVFLYRQGKAEEALTPLESAVARYPGASRAHLELGCVLLELNRLPAAEAHLEKAVALDAKSGRSHLLLGKVYLRLGKESAGEEQLRLGSATAK